MISSGSQPALARLQRGLTHGREQAAARPRTGLLHGDADGTVGTSGTDDAQGFDPLPVLRALSRERVPAVVIGQVAGILHGSPESTGDLDLLWSGDADLAVALARAFASLGAQLCDADDSPIDCAAPAFLLPKVVFRTPTAAGDCCTPALPWGLAVGDFLGRACELRLEDGTRVRFLDLQDLVAMRVAAGRPKDLRRAAQLTEGQADVPRTPPERR